MNATQLRRSRWSALPFKGISTVYVFIAIFATFAPGTRHRSMLVAIPLAIAVGAINGLLVTKVNLIPDSVSEIRVVDIVGLDRQADGGTHVRSTGEVGRMRVVKTENKGRGNKRIRVEIVDS